MPISSIAISRAWLTRARAGYAAEAAAAAAAAEAAVGVPAGAGAGATMSRGPPDDDGRRRDEEEGTGTAASTTPAAAPVLLLPPAALRTMPSCPKWLLPHMNICPLVVSAALCASPAASCTTGRAHRASTRAGDERSRRSPRPSCPAALAPQA